MKIELQDYLLMGTIALILLVTTACTSPPTAPPSPTEQPRGDRPGPPGN